MILEAFSKYLHEADPALSSTDVLARWLWEKLSMPPQNNVDQVIHCEIMICLAEPSEKKKAICELLIPKLDSEIAGCLEERLGVPSGESCRSQPKDCQFAYVFRGTSKSGERLLNSLKEYCLSYEHQKWARWVHNIKASDFRVKDASSEGD